MFVMDAVCLLFDKPQTWESAKEMMADTSFFQELIFYDKDHIPEQKFKALARYINHPEFNCEIVRRSSQAAAAICSWVRGVYQYSSIHRKMQPHIKNLLDAENRFTKVSIYT